MKRQTAIRRALSEFESYLSDRAPKPFSLVLAEDVMWTPAQRNQNVPTGYPHNLTGVFIYSDVCTESDSCSSPQIVDSRYTVVRYIGSATNTFYDETRKKNWKKDGNGGYCIWFTHRWIEIVPIAPALGFITLALEDFLLQRLRTTENKRRVPKRLLTDSPYIYDELSLE